MKEIQDEQNADDQPEQNKTDQKKMDILFRFIVPEDVAKQQVVELKTAAKTETKPATTFFLPGFEGFAFIFEKIAEKLQSKAKGIQFSLNRSHETIQELAEDVCKVLFTKKTIVLFY